MRQNGWQQVRVGDALRLVNGRAFKPSEWRKSGTPIIRIQNLNDPDASFNYCDGALPERFRVRDGDLLFAWSGTPGTSFGAHIWRGGDAWLNQHIFRIEFNTAEFDRRFLQLAINQNLAEYIRAAHGGAGLAHITKGKFEDSQIPRPDPDVQQGVVAEVEKQFTRLDAAVAALKRVQANLKRYRAAVLKAACEGQLVETEASIARREARRYEGGGELLARIRADHKRSPMDSMAPPAPKRSSDEQALPIGWCRTTVAQVAQIGSGNTPAGIAARVTRDGEVPWFKVGDMNHTSNKRTMIDADHYLSVQDVERLRLRLFQPGTVVFPKRGGAIATNKKRLLVRPSTLDLNVMALTPHPWIREFFFLWFSTVDLATLSDGSNVPQVNNKDILPLVLPVPPVSEQQRIVTDVERRLSVVDELEATAHANLQRAARLRHSVLQDAFSGRLAAAKPLGLHPS